MDDARVLELTWLAQLEQQPKRIGPLEKDTPERRLAIHLLAEGFANPYPASSVDLYTNMKARLEAARWEAVRALVIGQEIELTITHAGAVRRAELEQQLQTGRIKDSMGLIWDGRHFRQDTRIALLDVSVDRPLTVAFVDLNDVKKVFNAKSRETGDDAIRRYLELIADLTAERGDAYRISGGADEVVILLPRLELDEGLHMVRTLLNALGREQVASHSLRAAAGVVVVTAAENVDELRARVGREEARAKKESEGNDGRPSVLAWPPDNLHIFVTPA